jgi:hypothetical protein
MLVIPGRPGKDLCDPNLGTSRRAILRAGGIGLFGITLPNLLRLQAAAEHGSPRGGKRRARSGSR